MRNPPDTCTDDGLLASLGVLTVHNQFRLVGGEETSAYAEVELLRSKGARVDTLIYDSSDPDAIRHLQRHPDELVFNRHAYARARELIRDHHLQVVHCHNLVPLVSTSVYLAARAEGVPVVQTVHDFRMGCLQGQYLREGRICERCRPGHHLSGVRYACYRGSRVQSLALGIAQTINAARGAWLEPALYVVPSRFVGDKIADWGFSRERIVVKPHFVPDDPGPPATERSYAIFVGRLSPEKGIDLLLDAWTNDRIQLVVVGDGPLRLELEARVRAQGKRNVQFAGRQDAAGVSAFLRHARFLVMPSTWYETFGLVLIEAYAHGVPVLATRQGAMAEIVEEGVTGLLFELNDSADLRARTVELEARTADSPALATGARAAYQASYSAQAQVGQLVRLYARALGRESCASDIAARAHDVAAGNRPPDEAEVYGR